MSPIDKFNKRADKVNSLLCVGLDSELAALPERFKNMEHPQFEFNRWIIEQTHEHVASYKANMAFYEARGDVGLRDLKLTIDYLNKEHSDIFTICDAKRGDIENSNRGYVSEVFDWLGFDAVTLHPYLGQEALKPFLERSEKGCIILCRTSNPGAGELQDLLVHGRPIWKIVAENVSKEWNVNNNCMLVIGATYAEEMKEIRDVVGDMTFLVPGIGAQGSDIAAAVRAGINSEGRGMIIHSARAVIFSNDPSGAARDLKDSINEHR